jgi:cardiolipin synthase
MRTMSTFTLLLPRDYVADATKHIETAKERVVLLAMVVAQGPDTQGLVDAILDAARRGVKVYVAADVFTYGELNGTFLRNIYFSKKARAVTNMGKLLRDAGVKFQWLGRAQMLIFSGRTHSKWCVIDDIVYTFGGVNMYQKGVENVDYMFKTTSKQLADKIVAEHMNLQRADKTGKLYKSHQFDSGSDHVLVDCGIIGNSIIYQHACDLATSATSIVYVSQYPPAGKLLRRIEGKQAALYFNEPKSADFLNSILIRITKYLGGVTSNYRKKAYLHAKFMIFYMPDGSRVAITGSHNFSYVGVMMGTREIALETRNAKVIDQLEGFLKKRVA